MTLGLALGNADQIIVAVDRRVTCGKAVIDDGASKIGHAVCDDASSCIALPASQVTDVALSPLGGSPSLFITRLKERLTAIWTLFPRSRTKRRRLLIV
jgi:hypothetical protein